MNEIREQLRSLFSMTDEEVGIFLNAFARKELKKDEVFIAEGVVCHTIGLIEKGLMKCVYNRNGSEVIDEFAFENNFATNYYSFLTGSPSSKEIRCLEDTIVHVISRDSLVQLGNTQPFMERMGRIMNEKLFLRMHERLSSLMLDTAAERYLKLVAQRKDLATRIPQYLIASYLNVKPETISRIRKKISAGLY